MSALALILAERGHTVTGSDIKHTKGINKLVGKGIKIFPTQSSTNIKTICKGANAGPLIVVSTAIPKNNPELEAAQEAKLAIIHRSDLLANLINEQPSIAIAGSHGKTTTSTIITTLLAFANEDPTAVIGGLVPYYNSNGHAGGGRLLIAEADESDGTLVKFKAELGVITNLELDHTNHFSNLQEMIKTMQRFGKGCRNLLANKDCPILSKHFEPSAWWSISKVEGVDFAAIPISLDGNQTIADIYEKEELIGQITLPLPGLHNLSNTIGAIGACRMEGIPFDEIQKGISKLQAPHRRFDFRGHWQGRQIVDDYAHHPSEVSATLSLARLMINSASTTLPKQPQRLVVVFQPHRYSRTKEFLEEFAIALGKADTLLLAPVYAAGEQPIEGADSKKLSEMIKKNYPKLPVSIATELNEIPVLLEKESLIDDLVLFMGAGDINTLWEKLNHKDSSKRWEPRLAA